MMLVKQENRLTLSLSVVWRGYLLNTPQMDPTGPDLP